MTIVAFEKEVSLKTLSLFSKAIVRQYCNFKLEKKTCNIYKWKEKVQKNTGRRRKVQVTKAAFKGLHRFVFFTAESLPVLKHHRVSEVFKGFKVKCNANCTSITSMRLRRTIAFNFDCCFFVIKVFNSNNLLSEAVVGVPQSA